MIRQAICELYVSIHQQLVEVFIVLRANSATHTIPCEFCIWLVSCYQLPLTSHVKCWLGVANKSFWRTEISVNNNSLKPAAAGEVVIKRCGVDIHWYIE